MDMGEVITKFPNFLDYIINFSSLTNAELIIFSLQIIIISIIILFLALLIFFFYNRKTSEEINALNLLKKVENLRKKNNQKNVVKKNKEDLNVLKDKNTIDKKSQSISLKDILIKKFKPKIEQQLQTTIEIIDFKSKDNNFEVLASISGTKLLLILDNSGKIIDYKRAN